MTPDVTANLHKNPWFSSLPLHLQDAMLANSKVKQLKTQAVIHSKGQAPGGLFFVHSGKVRISNFTPDGKEVVLTWLTSGDWFGEISSFDNLPRTHCATVDEPATILTIPHKAFAQLCDKYPEMYRYFIPIFCQRIRALFEIIDEARTLPIKLQLIKRLLHLYSTFDGENGGLDVSQESLALMLNTTRQSVNRWLNELQTEGLIQLAYNKVMLEPKILQEYLHNQLNPKFQ